MVTVEIDKTLIGDNNKTYFIAEGGLNHNGDLNIAKQLIETANDCGANAIKFQTFKTEEFLAKSSQYFDIFKNVELTYEEFGELFDYAKKVGITFTDWLRRIRVAKAMDIIRTDDRSITEVAFEVGFGDLRTFERAFKKYTKLTPREFKQSVLP